jgi:hypothetical protein
MRNRVAVLKLKTVSTVEPGLPSSESPVEYRHDRFGRAGAAGFPTRGKCAIVLKVAEVLSSSFHALPQCAS